MPQELLNGLKNYIAEHGDEIHALAVEGQHPDVLFIGCMDSRCNPGTIMKAALGKFFGHSPMGGIVPSPDVFIGPSELKAKLKYAVEYIDSVHHIILMPHTQCGAIEALVNDLEDPDISPWINVAHEAFDRAKALAGEADKEKLLRMTEMEALKLSLNNLKEYSVVRKGIESGKIEIHGWLYDMMNQDILELDQKTGEFHSLIQRSAAE